MLGIIIQVRNTEPLKFKDGVEGVLVLRTRRPTYHTESEPESPSVFAPLNKQNYTIMTYFPRNRHLEGF